MSVMHLIGGGPSARDLDTTRLDGFRIGLNDAAFHKPVDAFFSLDHNYVISVRDRLEAFPGQKHFCIRQRAWSSFLDWPGITKLWRREDHFSPITVGGALSSGPPGTPGCSGYCALNLALVLGARTIYLHGYDFHEPYSYFFDPNVHDRLFVPAVLRSFVAVAPIYRSMGVRIVNCNLESAIDAFEKSSRPG